MKILIVAATWMEVKFLTDELEFFERKSHNYKSYFLAGNKIDVLITGVGAILTTFHLTRVLSNKKYHLVINVGIAASLSPDIEIGEVVNVVSEEFADLGIEKIDNFLTLFESGYIRSNEFPFEKGLLNAKYIYGFSGLKKVRGITTNKSHGRSSSIDEIKRKFSAQTESMEGAAVFFVCNFLGIDCCQIRGVSNYVEPRDSSQWDIPLALENLKTAVLEVLNELSVPVV
ncbi:MAG: futalosine hydrolase [Bacteroidia bacterium]|nr:futalosine hydrolase [Bacteroidia bacterium]